MNNRHYMPPEACKKIYEVFNQIYRTGNPAKKVDYQVTRKDGKCGFHELSASLLRDKAGRPIGFRGVSHDITDRKLAEDALVRAHEELETRVQERTAELAKVNEALEVEITERKRAEHDLQRYSERLEEMVEERTRELKDAQQELVNKAMEAGRFQLSAMVLHNIGNAITPIKVYTEGTRWRKMGEVVGYLEKCYQDPSAHSGEIQCYVHENPKGREVFPFMGKLVDYLKGDAEEMVKLVNGIDMTISYVSDIITLQQRYAPKEVEIKEEVDLKALLEDALRMNRSAFEKRDIIVRKEFGEGLPRVLIDKSRLVQVLVNLIKNSYEAIDEAGEGERAITVKTFSKDGDLHVEITDTGMGIEPESMNTIFEFGKSYKGSSGVGLYYCRMFVEANRGALTVTSPGKGMGATVAIRLPSVEARP